MSDVEIQIDWDELRAAFAEESRDLLSTLEAAALALELDPSRTEQINEAFRAVHSLKGAAATLGMTAIAELSHDFETMLDAWRQGELSPTPAHFGATMSTIDALRGLLEAGDQGVDFGALRAELVQLSGVGAAREPSASSSQQDVTATSSAAREFRIRFAPQPDAFQLGGDPALVLREVISLCRRHTVALDLSRLPDLDALTPDHAYLGWTIELEPLDDVDEARLREAFSFFDGVAELTIESVTRSPQEALPRAPSEHSEHSEHAAAAATSPSMFAPSPEAQRANADASTIRVAIDKVDRVIDLVGELVIAQSAVRELVRSYNPQNQVSLQEAVLVSERHLRELQERVMSVRMVPVSIVFARLPRVVRDLGQKLGKQIALDLQGVDTELDKSLAERLVDPLLHLVRNALDHGIESPEERRSAGKSPTASLRASAYARGGSVFVEVSDDGRGLDRDRIRDKAIARGLLDPSEALSDDQVFKLICSPGFSTKDQTTDVSGRGVGLDVVQSNLQAMGGDLRIESQRGQGTLFSMRLPLTLGIMDGLILTVGTELCVLPITDVAFSLSLRPGQARVLAGCAEVVDLPNETLPLLDLATILRANGAGGFGPELAVVVQAGAYRYALRVDGLMGQTQAVVKSLETHYRRVPGVMGATILGNGRVALILDGQGIAQNAGLKRMRVDSDRSGTQERARWNQQAQA